MPISENRVLLVGERLGRDFGLAKLLASWGADCQFATSAYDAQLMIRELPIAIALSELKPGANSLGHLVSVFEHHPTSVFGSYPIEDGCLWIPLLSGGKACLGAPFLRAPEFAELLQRVLRYECAGTLATDQSPRKASPLAPRRATLEQVALLAKAG